LVSRLGKGTARRTVTLYLKSLLGKITLILHNVFHVPEYEPYVACAGEVSRKCYSVADNRWEHHANALRLFLDFINCYDEETKRCDAPIARHMNTVIQAFKKHLQEKHGLFGEMMKEIEN